MGEYGISKNPESFVSHAFRIYFSDKARGSVLRLSRDGLTTISDTASYGDCYVVFHKTTHSPINSVKI